VWHSGICVRGREYYFGGGIFHEPAGATPYGRPDKRLVLGRTRRTRAEFEAFLDRVRPRFRMQDYDLLKHNCNNFTNECSIFLTGAGIPVDVIELPNRALSTPLGQMLRPQIEAYRESMVQQFAGADARITAQAAAAGGAGGVHASLHVPLFTSGKPLAFATGSLDKAVERLGQLLRENGHSLLATESIMQLALVTNAANFSASFPEARLAPLVDDVVAAMEALPSAAHYPLFDILRVVCLHSRGSALVLGHAKHQAIFKFLFEAQSSKLSFMAALRLLQNLMLSYSSPSDCPLVTPPLDTATARMLVAGVQSPELQVRKGAAFAAYNFALAMQQQGEDEASVIFVSGVGHYLKAPNDAIDSYEFLSMLLSLGTICIGHVKLISLFRSFKLDLRPFRAGANDQLRMTLDQLDLLLNA
jgi:hypothetical protein